MQVTTLSCFRFDTPGSKLWAFGQMQFARGPLKKTPGITFSKLMGSGTGESFNPRPNFGVYAVMLVWPSLEAARDGLANSPVLARYKAQSAESFTMVLSAFHAWGAWDGLTPFEVEEGAEANVEPIGVLTRATLKKNILLDFWKSVPAVSDQIAREHGLIFKLGMGEVPWVQQVTFSIWRDVKQMRNFAYRSQAHSDAIRQARAGGWFKEDLFARFRIIDTSGTWEGRNPMRELADA